MPPTQAQIELVRKYEPILFFHQDERFFPVDPKRYIEECALWRTRRPTRSKDDWGEEAPGEFPKRPLRRRRSLAAVNSQTELLSDTWLGDLLPTEPDREDRFLALTRWEDADAVGVDTENRHSDLDDIARLYEPDVTPGLALSRFWYYAEILDEATLTTLVRQTPAEQRQQIDLEAVLARLDIPRLILYHLFYPAHEEPLEGCEGFGDGSQFASYSGEWGCVAVLEESGIPTRVGLTQRNVGTLLARDDDSRLGMTVLPWGDAQHVEGHPLHPKVFVARGTHSNYLTTSDTGEHPVAPFTSESFDISRDDCGRIEEVDDAVVGTFPPVERDSVAPILLAKLGGSGLVGGLTGGAVAVVGGIVALAEALMAELTDPFEGILDPDRHPTDLTPGGTSFGTVIRPQGVNVPEVGGGPVWRTGAGVAPGGEFATTDGRRYGFIVDRNTQVWWRTRPGSTGYDGRWGLAVDHDPKARRSGMRLPHFWRMFMIALARSQ